MEDLREELTSLPGVSHVRAYMGRGAWEKGGEETFVLRFEGNGEARKALAMAGARWGQDSVLFMEPPTPDNHHVVTELSFDRKLTKAEVDGINERMTAVGFGGWTWGMSRDRYTAMLRVAAVPDYDAEADAKHAGRITALTAALDAGGLGYQPTQFEAAMTTIGPKGRTAYQTFIDGLATSVTRALTEYQKRYIKEGRGEGESSDGDARGVGRSGQGGLGEGNAGGRSATGRLAGRADGVARAADSSGRSAGDVRQPASAADAVRIRVAGALRLLGRLITKGGPGSGHFGHEGRPGERGGSLPGDATAQGEQAATAPYIGVPASVAPVGTKSTEFNAKDIRQPSGAPVRGTAMALDDPRIPDTVYHMTSNLPAIAESGAILARGAGGLGGDQEDQIVSLSISKDIAYQLASDMRFAVEVVHEFYPTEPKSVWDENQKRYFVTPEGERMTPDERLAWGTRLMARLDERAAEEGWKYSDWIHPSTMETYNIHDQFTSFFIMRQRGTDGRLHNPLIFTESRALMPLDASRIGVIEVPKANLGTGAMLTDFDLDNQYGLKEIRLYGDLPLADATFHPAT